jgi:hypothetical protein
MPLDENQLTALIGVLNLFFRHLEFKFEQLKIPIRRTAALLWMQFSLHQFPFCGLDRSVGHEAVVGDLDGLEKPTKVSIQNCR